MARVGVTPPLRMMLAGRGDDGGMELCFAIIAIFFLRVERRVLIMATTIYLLVYSRKDVRQPGSGFSEQCLPFNTSFLSSTLIPLTGPSSSGFISVLRVETRGR